MKAKEKAMEIAMKFDKYGQTDNAVKCALICVDEIINTGVNQDYIKQEGYMLSLVEFYAEVKQEINRL